MRGNAYDKRRNLFTLQPSCYWSRAIRDTYKEWYEAGEQNKQIKVLEAESDGAIAYFTAAYSGDFIEDDGTFVNESGVVLAVCVRAPDGTWKMHISSLNSDTPPLAEA